MFIENKAIVHIIDTATKFSAAMFLTAKENNMVKLLKEYGQHL